MLKLSRYLLILRFARCRMDKSMKVTAKDVEEWAGEASGQIAQMVSQTTAQNPLVPRDVHWPFFHSVPRRRG